MNTTTRNITVRKSAKRMAAEAAGWFSLLGLGLLGVYWLVHSVLPATVH